MSDRSADDTSRGRAVSRRTAITGLAATVAGVGAVGRATGQITTTGVIPTPGGWTDNNLAGYMIHLGGELSPEQPASVPECDYAEWPPDDVQVYESTIINRKDAETPEKDSRLFVDATVGDFLPGQLFLINTFSVCGEEYVGVQLEQIGRRFRGTATGPHYEIEDDERPDESTGTDSNAIGPGMGVVDGALAAVGLGGLAAWRRTR